MGKLDEVFVENIEIVETILEEIEEVIPLYPELVSDNFKDVIITAYNDKIITKHLLYQAREKVRELEKSLIDKENNYNKQTELFEVKFKKIVKEKVMGYAIPKRKGRIY